MNFSTTKKVFSFCKLLILLFYAIRTSENVKNYKKIGTLVKFPQKSGPAVSFGKIPTQRAGKSISSHGILQKLQKNCIPEFFIKLLRKSVF